MPDRESPTQGIHDIEEPSEGFPKMSGEDADKECGTMGGFYPEQCPTCKAKIILHCDKCKIQVSACWCTKMDELDAEMLEQADLARMNPEMRAKVIEQRRLAQARESLESEGFWIPGTHHGDGR